MSIPAEAQALIEEEEQTLERVLSSLRSQLGYRSGKLHFEAHRAKSLTSEYITARVDEKQQLASDESVSHRLRDMHQDDVSSLTKLLERPYFARLSLKEEMPNGQQKRFDYLLGFASNPDCRIIDWRNAPLARLYYEYKEGDEYSEIVQGREREGHVLQRVQVEIENGELIGIRSASLGSFVKQNGEWQAGALSKRRSGGMPDVLALITQEQFQAITLDNSGAVMIRGVAGSGKTTVALHRLAWLCSSSGVALPAEECRVIVRSPVLASYIELSKSALQLSAVPVDTYGDWLERQLQTHGFKIKPLQSELRNPLSVKLLATSAEFLNALTEASEMASPSSDWESRGEIVREIVRFAIDELKPKTSRLQLERTPSFLTGEALEELQQVALSYDGSAVPEPLAAAVLVSLQLIDRRRPHPTMNSHRHVVVDELQDFAALEVASVLFSARSIDDVTLAGDEAQSINDGVAAFGWESLTKLWRNSELGPQYVSLSVSHRSTKQIMHLADHVLGQRRTKGGKPGKRPIWFHCGNENYGVEQVLNWLKRVSEKFPLDTIIVICPTISDARTVSSLLDPTFGALVSIGEDRSFSFEEGIVVTGVAQCKGLEFPHVMIWNPSQQSYPSNERGRNALYVAITRAEEHVALVTWERPSRHLPHIHSPLVRGIDYTEEEEEKEREQREFKFTR